MPNVDLISKLIVLFTLRAFVPEADVLLAKPRDFRAFLSLLGVQNGIIESILKYCTFVCVRD